MDFDEFRKSANHPCPRVVFRLFDKTDCPDEVYFPALASIFEINIFAKSVLKPSIGHFDRLFVEQRGLYFGKYTSVNLFINLPFQRSKFILYTFTLFIARLCPHQTPSSVSWSRKTSTGSSTITSPTGSCARKTFSTTIAGTLSRSTTPSFAHHVSPMCEKYIKI